jgi:hypothetical protein
MVRRQPKAHSNPTPSYLPTVTRLHDLSSIFLLPATSHIKSCFQLQEVGFPISSSRFLSRRSHFDSDAMDPLSALSAAAGVVQFLDYGTRVMSKSRELYTAADGALSANVEIEEASARLQSLRRALVVRQGDEGFG